MESKGRLQTFVEGIFILFYFSFFFLGRCNSSIGQGGLGKLLTQKSGGNLGVEVRTVYVKKERLENHRKDGLTHLVFDYILPLKITTVNIDSLTCVKCKDRTVGEVESF